MQWFFAHHDFCVPVVWCLQEIETNCGLQLCMLFPPDESIDLYQVIHKMRHKRRTHSEPRSRGRPPHREPAPRDLGRLEMFFGLLVRTCVTWRAKGSVLLFPSSYSSSSSPQRRASKRAGQSSPEPTRPAAGCVLLLLSMYMLICPFEKSVTVKSVTWSLFTEWMYANVKNPNVTPYSLQPDSSSANIFCSGSNKVHSLCRWVCV